MNTQNNTAAFAIIDDSEYNKYIHKSIDNVSFLVADKNDVFICGADISRILPELYEDLYPSELRRFADSENTLSFVSVKYTNKGAASTIQKQSHATYFSKTLLLKYAETIEDATTQKVLLALIEAVVESCLEHVARNIIPSVILCDETAYKTHRNKGRRRHLEENKTECKVCLNYFYGTKIEVLKKIKIF